MSDLATAPPEATRLPGRASLPWSLGDTDDETRRLRALARYAILDTPRDATFDDLVGVAVQLTGCQVAAIGFYDAARVWFKAAVGLDAQECPRDVRVSDPLTIRWFEAVESGTFVSVPCVTSDGYTLGCLVVADPQPKQLSIAARVSLAALARQVVHLLELRRTLLSYHTVVDGVGNVVFHIDEQGRLVSVTPTWAKLTGFGVVRSLGRALSDFVHEDDRDRFTEQLGAGQSGQTPPVVLCRLLRLGGADVPVEIVARGLVDEGGRHLGLVGVIADITERQAREVEAQHLQKLEALGRLSAGLAHEINTPIQFVGDNARFLAESYQTMLKLLLTYRKVLDVESGAIPWWERQELIQQAEREADVDYLAEEVPAAVEQSLEGVERVASLVRAMKTFSHPGTTEKAPADLNEALRATMTVARNQVKYIADEVLDLGDIPLVVCNIADLNQVFLNMVINAADAIEETGERGAITITSCLQDGQVAVSVSDTGAGIPEPLQLKIFEPFFTTKDVGRGTGQGLALARAVVHDQHGGSITVRSRVGAGTTITIHLPIEPPSDELGSAS
ncbi:nitrogen regulation protein NR(II) [Angustibacter sp. Root456]|uniref:two-component system sensor histidine kinase NtrB n=1 Tax=Angustibacter sp. Root456 TaxID=1736539 RepID=UPI00138ED22D|nr:ATP-binding protein [Angustibacter sp. Root456]